MRGVNKAIILGTVGRDPEIRYTADQKPIANLSLATNEVWTDKSGNKQEKAEWHKVVIFGKLAEIAQQYVTKGSQLYIEGKITTRKWQDQSGMDRYSTEIVLDPFNGVMQMVGGKGGSAAQTPQNAPQSQNGQRGGQPQQFDAEATPQGVNQPQTFDDDIPF